MRWFRKLLGLERHGGSSVPAAQDIVESFSEAQRRIKAAGSVESSYYTDHVERVKQLKREKRHPEAIELLLKLVDATENESKVAGEGWGVAPWYYEQLAIIYRKEKRYGEEVAILERYQAQPKAPGVGPTKLAECLEKAKQRHNTRAQ